MTVLIAAASRHGATSEIAARIGARLAERGIDFEVKKLEQIGDLRDYDAFVIGSGIYLASAHAVFQVVRLTAAMRLVSSPMLAPR